MSSSSSVQFINSICAIKSVISLEMKCPQLSKPEATMVRNQTPSVTEQRKKPWEKPGSRGWGGSSPLARQTSSLFQLQVSQIVRAPLVPVVFPDGCLGDEVLTSLTLFL